MGALRRILAAILGSAVVLVAAACTAGREPGPRSTAATSDDGRVISEDGGATPFVPGRFVYRFADITAEATFEAGIATVTVRNDSDSELGSPSLYVIGADDRRYDGSSGRASPVGVGEQTTLRLRFPDALDPQAIGLVVLSFGDLNVGAMAPVPVSGS